MRCERRLPGDIPFYKAWSQFQWNLIGSDLGAPTRRASFADAYYTDVDPVTDPATNTTKPSRPGQTFQAAPELADCDCTLPQSAYPSGLPVAMMDGSVRFLRASVSPSIFWGAVTRNGGESIDLD
jgi:hypothetical protein